MSSSSYNKIRKGEKVALNKIEAAMRSIRRCNRCGEKHPGPEGAKKVPVVTNARGRESEKKGSIII